VAGYTALIDLRVNGLDGLKKVTDSITSINNLIKQIKPVPTLFDQKNRGGTEAERASVQKAKDALSGLVKAYAEGDTRVAKFSTSMAGLSNQIRFFNAIVGNAKVGSEDFVDGIVAAERASRKLTNAEYDRLRVLRNIYTAERTGGRTTTTAAQEVLERGRKVLGTDASGLKSSINELELYEAEIKTVFATVSQGTPVFRELQIALAAVNKELNVARGMGAIQGPALPAGFTEQGVRSGTFPSSPIRGGVGMEGSPLARDAQRKQLQNVLIGGGFPMLFGGGAGAVLGGAAGGLIPGNPMMSIVTSALGTMVDQFVAGVTEMGVAVKDLVGNFDKLKEANLFVSKQQEFYIQKLIESGRAQEAANAIQQRLIDIIGTQGVQDLDNAGQATTRLNKALAELGSQMQALIAGPLGVIIDRIAAAVALPAASNTATAVQQQLVQQGDKAAAGELGSRVQEIEQRPSLQLGLGAKEAAQDITKLTTAYSHLLKKTETNASISLADQEKQLLKSLETAEKVRDIRKQTIGLERSSQDLRLSIEDTVYGLRKRATDMERDSMEFRRSVEDQVFSKRQQLEQQLLDNDRKRQQNAIDAFDLQLKAASSNLDPIAQGVVDAAREYLRVRAEGEADLQQKEKQLKLQLQQIDQEVSRYTLQVEQRVTQMVIQREEFSRDVSRSKLQIERQIGDYITKVEEYRLKMARMRFDLALEEGNIAKATEIARKQGLGAPASGKNFANVGGFMNGRQMLHGIPGFAGFDKSHATPENIHYHFAGKNPVETKAIAELVKAQGFQVTEFKGFGQRVGKHAPGSQHYSGNAFDIPGASMEGRGGMADIVAGQKRVHAIINDALAAGVGKTAGQTTSQVTAATPSAPTAPTMPGLPSAPQLVGVNDLLEQYLNLQTQIKAAAVANVQLDKENLAVNSDQARLALEQKLLQPLQQHVEQNRELEFENQQRRVRNRLLAEGMAPEIVEGELRVLEIERDLASVLEGLNVVTNKSVNAALKRANANATLVDSTFQLTEATLTGLLATTEDTKKQEELRAKLQQVLDTKNSLAGLATGTATGAITGAQGAAAGNIQTPAEKIEGRIGTLKKEVADLTNIGNIAITVADGIGAAFANAFTGLISGSMTAKEALGSFFKSVGDMFLEMAAQIIAKQMTMIILQTILKALGAVAGAGGGGAELSSGFDAGSASALPTDSAGWSQSFATKLPGRAVGGPVTSQQPYMVGERGPELFVPGTGGSVVNNSDLRSAMNQDRAAGAAVHQYLT
jgi:hypothetical protein